MGLVANGTNALRVVLRTIVVIDEKHLVAVLFRHWHSRQRPTTISSTNKSGEESVLEVDIEPPVEAPGILDEAQKAEQIRACRYGLASSSFQWNDGKLRRLSL